VLCGFLLEINYKIKLILISSLNFRFFCVTQLRYFSSTLLLKDLVVHDFDKTNPYQIISFFGKILTENN